MNLLTNPQGETESWLGAETIETYEGKAYRYGNPDFREIDLVSIAQSLSQTVRFGGHCREWMSVAQHSLLVVDILEAEGAGLELQQGGLLHDGQEAFVRDHPRPMKSHLGSSYKALETEADHAIAEAFDITVEAMHDPLVKAADRMAMTNEGHAVMRKGPAPEEIIPLPVGVEVFPVPGLNPLHAKQAFLSRAYKLGLFEKQAR